MSNGLSHQREPRILASVCALGVLLFALNFAPRAHGQQAQATLTPAASATLSNVLPNLVRFSGRAADLSGKPMTGSVGVTIALYEQETGGPALWLETQNVQPDATGHYTLLLGATRAEGLSTELFSSGQARWVGAQVSGQAEQPRVMLLTVPYAMKAGDAATVGGLPPSAFMLAAPAVSNGSPANATLNPVTASPTLTPAASDVTTTGGTASTIPMFTAAATIQNSILTQTGASAINVGGKLNLPSTGAATATAGRNSRAELFVGSAFSSATAAAVPQTFQLQAEPAGNNTATPSGTLNLLYGSGTTAPRETGFKIGSTGILSFATGQTFPGTGNITGVSTAAGSGLTGGGTTGVLSLGLLKTCTAGQVLQWSGTAWVCATGSGGGGITGVAAGTDLTGGGTTGKVTLNLDTTKVPQLATANSFTGTQQFQGNVGVAAAPSGTGYTPLSVGGNTSFGTWLALSNTSTGGHTWNIISAGSGNAEGAGNIGITDLTGASTIWLEGNTKTTNLTASGTVGAAALVVTNTAGSAIIDADGFGANAGGPTPGLRFGGGSSGEGISSNRVIGATKFGLDFYTEFVSRMSIHQNGQVGIGTSNPGAQLGVIASSNAYPALFAQAADAPTGSGADGSDGFDALGSAGDPATSTSTGGTGMFANGGMGFGFGGAGAVISGGPSSFPTQNQRGGDGIVAYAGSDTGSFGPWAGYFDGNIDVNGSVHNNSALIKIDHPLDPSNKYLLHATVVSPEMKTIYDGNVTTDASGNAVVELPEWFESLNRDFRYQLTVLGQFAQAIVAGKIANHQFIIRTDKPNVEVSWQVTGIRQDAWANAHSSPVEMDKPLRERGHYLHPELFGAPEEAGVDWARHPQIMKRIKERRLKAEQSAGLATAATSNR